MWRCLGRRPGFDTELEDQLASYCKKMADRGFGLSANRIKLVMMRMAAKLGRTINVKRVYRGFRSRHRELTIRCAEAADRLRCGALTKENMDRHFQNLKEIFDHVEKAQGYPVQARQVLNLDESCESPVLASVMLHALCSLVMSNP